MNIKEIIEDKKTSTFKKITKKNQKHKKYFYSFEHLNKYLKSVIDNVYDIFDEESEIFNLKNKHEKSMEVFRRICSLYRFELYIDKVVFHDVALNLKRYGYDVSNLTYNAGKSIRCKCLWHDSKENITKDKFDGYKYNPLEDKKKLDEYLKSMLNEL